MPLNYGALGKSDEENKMFQDAELAIDKDNLFEWLARNDKLGPLDYSTSNDVELAMIGHNMKYKHTAESFNRTMYEMHHLARLGIDAYCASYTQAIAAPSAPKEVVQRSPEMDAKVIDEILNRAPFKRAPKWSQEYVTLYPDVLNKLPRQTGEFKKPGVSDPTTRRLNF
jgi:hypothetical protein